MSVAADHKSLRENDELDNENSDSAQRSRMKPSEQRFTRTVAFTAVFASPTLTRLLLLCILATCSMSVLNPWPRERTSDARENQSQMSAQGTLDSSFSQSHNEIWKFQYNGAFVDLAPYTPDSDNDNDSSRAAWSDLLPQGRGLVSRRKLLAASLSLPPASEDTEKFSVTAFHELHCLYMLQEAFRKARAGEEVPLHANHCLDYMRQLLLCHADGTLEPVKPELDNGVDGYGRERTCRAFGDLRDRSAELRSSDGFGIL